jgi:hypothetical protein
MHKKIAISLGVAALVLAGAVEAATWSGGRPRSVVLYDDWGPKVQKVCDYGRAVYVANGISTSSGVSMVVIEDAPECQFGQ